MMKYQLMLRAMREGAGERTPDEEATKEHLLGLLDLYAAPWIGKQNDPPPVLILNNRNGTQHPLVIFNGWDTTEEREQTLERLGRQAAANGEQPLLATLATIAYMVKVKKNADVEGIVPSEHPDRCEVLMLASVSLDGCEAFLQVPVKPDAEGWNIDRARMQVVTDFEDGGANMMAAFWYGFIRASAGAKD
ncbi:MAG: hypothetical protein Q8Q08_12920 [Candidatus Omnitrophota bacterium]|nr:hypothetical protein [Candidatus Omnitrophota bacterium]